MGVLKKTDEQMKKIKKRRTEILLGLILILFIIYKFSLYNYFSFVGQKDAKALIRDFERNYLYSESINTQVYRNAKNEILSNSFTSKEKLAELFEMAKKGSNDNYSTFRYADILKGKFNYSTNKRMKFESKIVNSDFAYIKIDAFGSNAGEKFYKALDKMEDKEYLIIDLRDNSRGNYNEAVEIADILLPIDADICYIENMKSKQYYSSDAFMFNFKKIFILVNQNTASSAEMLALTLKENLGDKVELIGKTTMKMPLGHYNKSYYNKIDLDIVTLKWFVKGKSAEALEQYLGKYSNTKLEKLDDYMNIVNTLK